MPDINFGLLQRLQGIPLTQVDAETSPENYRANMANDTQRMGILSQANIAQGALAAAQQQNAVANDIARERNGMLQRAQSQSQGSNKDPRIVEAELSGKILDNQTKQEDLTTKKNVNSASDQAISAYSDVLANGGTKEQAMDALVEQTVLRNPETGMKVAADRAVLKKNLEDGKHEDNARAGDLLFNINNFAKEQGMSPRDYVSKLAKSNPDFLKQNPLIPDPSKYSDDDSYHIATGGVMSYATASKEQLKSQYEAQAEERRQQFEAKKQELEHQYKLEESTHTANLTSEENRKQESAKGTSNDYLEVKAARDKAKQELANVVNTKGVSSPDAKQLMKDIAGMENNMKTKEGKTTLMGFIAGNAPETIESIKNSLPKPNKSTQSSKVLTYNPQTGKLE